MLGEAKSGAAICAVRLRMHTVASVRTNGKRRNIGKAPSFVM
jgi:hypothetical protein